MRAVVLALLAALLGGTAFAADEPSYGPPPAWVKVADLPSAQTDSTEPMEMLLHDEQLKAVDGGVETYARVAFKVNAPEALSAAGNLTFPWRPDIADLTINTVHLIRDGQVIDVLADGQKFTVLRREQDLEHAVLDGVLTAVLQPAGLQVGDIVDFSISSKIHDPAQKGHIADLTGNLTSGNPRRLRIRLLWPKDQPIRWRAAEELAKPKVTNSGNETEVLIDMTDVHQAKAPDGAPPRFSRLGFVELSDFSSWKEVSALTAPLYATATTLKPDSPLKAQIEKIRAQSNDPKVQAQAALRLVEDQVRYVALLLDNGFTPASADETWARRFGDCKAKSALLVALLQGLGIEAEPAYANLNASDGLETHLPFLYVFNHVIVRAVIGGKVYWLDGTRSGDRNLDDQPATSYRWALPITAQGADLEKLPPYVPAKPQASTTLALDASGGLDVPAPAKATITYRGDIATFMRLGLQSLGPAERDEAMRKVWKGQYSWIEPKTLGFTSDEATGEVVLTMEGDAKMDWSPDKRNIRRYETDGSNLGWTSALKRDGGPHQDAPFAVTYPDSGEMTETIILPHKGEDFSVVGKDYDRKVGVWQLTRTAAIHDGVFTLHAVSRALAPEISAADAAASAAPLAELRDDEVFVEAGLAYQLSDPTPTASITDPDLLNQRCWFRATMNKDLDGALADCDAALKLKPDSAAALDSRGLVHLRKGDLKDSISDYDAALKLKPSQAESLFGRGIAKLRNGLKSEGDADLAAARKLDPGVDATYAAFGVSPSQAPAAPAS